MGPPPRAERCGPHGAAPQRCSGARVGLQGAQLGGRAGLEAPEPFSVRSPCFPYRLLLRLPAVDSSVARIGLGSSRGPSHGCTPKWGMQQLQDDGAWGVGHCTGATLPTSPLTPLSPAGQDLVPEQALQVQEDHEAGLERSQRGAAAPAHLLLAVPLLPQHPPALGHPCAGQRAPAAPQQLHQQLRSLVPAAPAGLRAPWSHDVTAPWLQHPAAPGGPARGGTCRQALRGDAMGDPSKWRMAKGSEETAVCRDPH